MGLDVLVVRLGNDRIGCVGYDGVFRGNTLEPVILHKILLILSQTYHSYIALTNIECVSFIFMTAPHHDSVGL